MTDPVRVAERAAAQEIAQRFVDGFMHPHLEQDAETLARNYLLAEQRLQELEEALEVLAAYARIGMEKPPEDVFELARALSIPEAERCHYCGGDCDPAYPCKAGADVSAPEPEQERKS